MDGLLIGNITCIRVVYLDDKQHGIIVSVSVI